MKQIISYVIILLVLASCTIQKRVHRPGWHVQWNKHRSVAKTIIEDSNKEKGIKEVFAKESMDVPSSIAPEPSNQKNNLNEPAEYQANVEDISNEDMNPSSDGLIERKVDEISQKERKMEPQRSQYIERADQHKKGLNGLSIPGLILLIVGFVLAIFALLCFIVVTSSSATFEILFAVIFGYIFGIAGLVLLIVGTSLLIAGLVYEKR